MSSDEPVSESLLAHDSYTMLVLSSKTPAWFVLILEGNESPSVRYLNELLRTRRPILVDSEPNIADVRDVIAAASTTPTPEAYVSTRILHDQKARDIVTQIVSEQEHGGFVQSAEYRSLGIGNLLTEISTLMEQRLDFVAHQGDQAQPRLALFACHDTTIAGLLASLEAMKPPNWIWPPFGSSLTIELFSAQSSSLTKQAHASSEANVQMHPHYVRLSFSGVPLALPACKDKKSHFPGNPSLCSLVSARKPFQVKQKCL